VALLAGDACKDVKCLCSIIMFVCRTAGVPSRQKLDDEAYNEDWHEERSALEAIYAEDVVFPSASWTVLRVKAGPEASEQVVMQGRSSCNPSCKHWSL
jgi:hypothetical protein